jgi:biotin synthase
MRLTDDTANAIRHDSPSGAAEALFALPFTDLIFRAQVLHRRYFDATTVQMSSLLSIKAVG